jgi:hypothetical protein
MGLPLRNEKIFLSAMGVDQKMSAHILADNSHFLSIFAGRTPSCHIRGRMISSREFLPRLKNYCLSLGFRKPIVLTPEPSAALDMHGDDHAASIFAAKNGICSGNDSVTLIAARVSYNPNWGVYGGLPRPLIHETSDCRTEGTIANFIAPYLAQYQFAQNHIYLACHAADQYLVILPPDLINSGQENADQKLKIVLDKMVELDGKGHYSPHSVSDSFVSYRLSAQFLHLLRENDFPWSSVKKQRIGRFLTPDLFVFASTRQVNGKDGNSGRNGTTGPFAEILLPVIGHIVTDAHPQLLAAMIHLQSEFSHAVDEMHHFHGGKDSENLLCVAGLDIDFGSFGGSGKRYFVPWAACLHRAGTDDALTHQLEQDDLFVALMAQEKNV